MNRLNLIFSYIATFNAIWIFILLLEIVELLLILISLLYFSWKYYSELKNSELHNYFIKLPLFNKIIVIWFTVLYAIPNKIWVNNNIPNFLVAFLIFLIIAVSNIFPPILLLYIIYWIFVLESYFFAVLYEDKNSFKHFINSKLFINNEIFAKEYFRFFWGNMTSGGAGKGRAGIIGTTLGGLFHIARNGEKTHVRVQGNLETQQHIKNAGQKPQTPEESFELQKKIAAHIVERDTVILKTEKKIVDLSEKVYDWFTNS